MSPSSRPLSTRLRESVFVRDGVVATALLAALYLLAPRVDEQALQIPGYLLIVGFDLLESVFGPVQSAFYVVFALYIVALGVAGAGLASGFRRIAGRTSLPAWRIGIAAALTVVAVIALGFGAMVYSGTMQSEPVQILGTTGVVLLALAALFADAFGGTSWLQAALER